MVLAPEPVARLFDACKHSLLTLMCAQLATVALLLLSASRRRSPAEARESSKGLSGRSPHFPGAGETGASIRRSGVHAVHGAARGQLDSFTIVSATSSRPWKKSLPMEPVTFT